MRKLLLTVLGAFTLLPCVARDFTYEYEGHVLTYTVLDENAKTCETKAGHWFDDEDLPVYGNVATGDLVIPSVAKDGETSYSVVGIGEYGITGEPNSPLRTVIIPPSVTEIGMGAIEYTVKKVAYPSDLDFYTDFQTECIAYDRDDVLIENGFVYDKDKTLMYFAPSQLEGAFAIPETVTAIHDWAFYYCFRLKSLTIPESVTSIGNDAFRDCSALESVNLPVAITSIGDGAFAGCDSLTTMEIPASVTSIGKSVFAHCDKLASVKLPYTLESIGDYAFTLCESLSEIEIPTSVKRIGEYAFNSCSGLDSIIIPESVTELGNYAFYACSHLKSAVIGNSVPVLGYGLFSLCEHLNSVVIGNSVEKIYWDSFKYCTSLQEVIMPPSVKFIDSYAFRGASKLNTIVMGHNVTNIGGEAFVECPAAKVYITAQTPPTAFDDTFYEYTGKLYVQGQAAMNAYANTGSCWNKFEMELMVEPDDMEINATTIKGNAGDTFQLTAKLLPENVSLPYIFWRSTNPDVATVDYTGLVTIHTGFNDMDSNSQNCRIIAESLYADGPVAEVKVNDSGLGVIESVADEDSNEIDLSAPMSIYTLQGAMVTGTVDNISKGIYILRQGKNVKKIIVK